MTAGLPTFYALLITQTLSYIGSTISSLAFAFWIFERTGEATPLTLVTFFSALPTVMASGLSGVLADRWDRRKVMLIADAGQAVCTVLLLMTVVTGTFALWHLYLATVLISAFGAFQVPAFQASVAVLVPADQRLRANTAYQITTPLTGIAAPVLAGLVYSLVGVGGALLLDLMTFVVAFVVVLLVRIPQPAPTAAGRALAGSVWRQLTGGFAYLNRHKPLLYLTLYFAAFNTLLFGTLRLTTPYVLTRLGADQTATLGLIVAVMNLGGLAGGVLLGWWGGTRTRLNTMLPGLALIGVFLALFGLARGPLSMALALFGVMFPIPIINALLMAIIQAKAPPDVQGRVFAAIMQLVQLVLPLAYLVMGPLADRVFEPAVGARGWAVVAPLVGSAPGAGMGLMLLGAGVLMVAGTLLVYALPVIRHLETRLPDYVTEAPPG